MADIKLTEDNLVHLQIFQALLPQVRQYIRRYTPPDWPALASVLSVVVDKPLGPLAILPLASCAAVSGDPHEAIPMAAAWEVCSLAMRILDDLQDQDRPDGLWAKVGLPRAFNFSATLYALCNELLAQAAWSAERYRAISRDFTQMALRLAAGQDQDMRGETRTIEKYWQLIENKNASAFALACAAGALCGTDDLTLVGACRTFGHHLGLALQLFDDFEGFWEPSGVGDLAIGKVTLPVLYGLSVAHDGRDELQQLVDSGQLDTHVVRVRDILDAIHTRDFMIWTALQERERALAALAVCPGQAGATALSAYVTAIFAHIEEVLAISSP